MYYTIITKQVPFCHHIRNWVSCLQRDSHHCYNWRTGIIEQLDEISGLHGSILINFPRYSHIINQDVSQRNHIPYHIIVYQLTYMIYHVFSHLGFDLWLLSTKNPSFSDALRSCKLSPWDAYLLTSVSLFCSRIWSWREMALCFGMLPLRFCPVCGCSLALASWWILLFAAGTSWLCFPSYVVITAFGSFDDLSTCFLTKQPEVVHL